MTLWNFQDNRTFWGWQVTNNTHDYVIKWKHFPRYWPFVRGIHWSPVNSPHIGQWRGALVFSLICALVKGCVNNREAGDLIRYRAHYDVTVMLWNDKMIHTGGWLYIKIWSYQYRKSHCGDKTILRPSYLHNGISYTGKMTSLYWIRAQVYVHLRAVILIIVDVHGLYNTKSAKGRTNIWVKRHKYE